MFNCLIFVLLLVNVLALERCQHTVLTQDRLIQHQESFRVTNKKPTPIRPVTIKVVVHQLLNDKGTEGRIPLDSILQTINLTNQVYQPWRIQFALVGLTYTYNSSWFYHCDDPLYSSQYKYYTSLSSATMMNVWTCYSNYMLGWVTYLPYELPETSVFAGIHLNYQAFPISSSTPSYPHYGGQDYNEGRTFAHEVGHYLGLLHTFGNGIDGCVYGDGVADTPPEKTAAFGKACYDQPPRKTCPGTPGVDPTTNIMDYGDDTCSSNFTAGQAKLMHFSIDHYRPSLKLNGPSMCATVDTMEVCQSQCQSGRCMVGTKVMDCQCTSTIKTLSCANKRPDEFTLATKTGCLTAVVDQVMIEPCQVTEYQRWTYRPYDRTISSVGTGWCLTNHTTTLTLKPCNYLNPHQLWPPSTKQGKWSLNGTQWQRGPSIVKCPSFKTKKACLSNFGNRGCSCRWFGKCVP
jgi:hypothetical protein